MGASSNARLPPDHLQATTHSIGRGDWGKKPTPSPQSPCFGIERVGKRATEQCGRRGKAEPEPCILRLIVPYTRRPPGPQDGSLCPSFLLRCFCQAFLPVTKLLADACTECALQGVGQEDFVVGDAVSGVEDGAREWLVGLVDQGIQPCASV